MAIKINSNTNSNIIILNYNPHITLYSIFLLFRKSKTTLAFTVGCCLSAFSKQFGKSSMRNLLANVN